MNFGFKNWRECTQDLIPLDLNKTQLYYIQARAWHFKGYIGGTHSWTTFFSKEHDAWLVAEYTDRETLCYQDGNIIYDGNLSLEDTKLSPYITTRSYNAQWFGADPYIVDTCLTPNFNEVHKACTEYPYKEFSLLNSNCNTFTSYLHWKLGLHLRRPLRSVGYKNKDWWQSRHGT